MVRNFIICILCQYHFNDQTVEKNKAEHSPWGVRPHPIVCRPSVCFGLRGQRPNLFPVFFVGGLITWEYDRYKRMNKPLALEIKLLSLQGPCWGTWRGAHLPGTLRERCRRKLWRWGPSL